MSPSRLPIPQMLVDLLFLGHWPQTKEVANLQNLHSFISSHLIRKIAPDESTIFLYAPPFDCVETLREQGDRFWDLPQTRGKEISFSKAIPIGDFGLGTEAPILLDYRFNIAEPSVIRLKWSQNGKNNQWVPLAASFQEFAAHLKLHTIDFPTH